MAFFNNYYYFYSEEKEQAIDTAKIEREIIQKNNNNCYVLHLGDLYFQYSHMAAFKSR